MKRQSFLILLIVGIASQLSLLAERGYCLPPLQVLNFDFGGGAAYVGDNGVLSSPGGTYWNAVSASDFTGFCCGSEDILDEFGQHTNGIVFSGFANWVNTSAPTLQGPRSDGIAPATSEGAALTFGRVHTFEEMIIYLNGPVGDIVPGTGYGGGFAASWYVFPPTIVVPFPYTDGAEPLFPGTEGVGYLRITSPPPRALGLGESPTFTIFLEDPLSVISAIQIRGRFAGAPEPSSAVLMVLGCSMVMLRRAGR